MQQLKNERLNELAVDGELPGLRLLKCVGQAIISHNQDEGHLYESR